MTSTGNQPQPASPSKSTPAKARADAARALSRIIDENRTIDWLEANDFIPTPLVAEFIYGVCRYYFSLEKVVDGNLAKPLRDKDRILRSLMLVGAYQLTRTRIKPHAIINETVNAVTQLKRPWAKGLVNAVLRQISRQLSKNTEQSFDALNAATNNQELPGWLKRLLDEEYADAAALHHANLTRAPMTLRVNLAKTTAAHYSDNLKANAISHQTLTNPTALTLSTPQAAGGLPEWDQGHVAVQDYGAQIVAAVAATIVANYAQPDILDACTAPGGKLFHLLEQTGEEQRGRVVALDSSAERIASTREIAKRLGHHQTLSLGDATQLDWWDESPFDFILLDAPCSGTGTLRRHPDIKLLLAPDDIPVHADMQLQLLQNLWSTLAVGGTLLYCTCSLLAAENDRVIDSFLAYTDKALTNKALSNKAVANKADNAPDNTDTYPEVLDVNKLFPLATGNPQRHGWQLSPTDPLTDGFYLAALRKTSPAGTRV